MSFLQPRAAVTSPSQDAVIVAGEEAVITHSNEAAERLFGYEAGGLIGRSLLSLIPPNDRDEFVQSAGPIAAGIGLGRIVELEALSLIHISEPTRLLSIS